jgi:cobalt-zinc-cadmium efflux system protein
MVTSINEYKHNQNYGYKRDSKGKNLLLTFGLNVIITIAEVVGGILSNSLALLSDAVHNLGDTFAILLAYIASLIGRRGANERKTFGYKRIEILAALLNAVILIVIILFLFIEAYKRFYHPEPVKGLIMFWVSLIGLLANLFSVIILKKDSYNSLNIRAAYLHLLGDTFSSVAVIAGSILIYYFSIYWVDPLITVLIGLYILKETYKIVKQTVDILMQGTPPSIDLQNVVKDIEHQPEISNVHHVHAWKLDDRQIHFECHADLKEDLPLSKTDRIRSVIEETLLNKYGISHVTIQFEYNCCDEKEVIHR